MYRALALAVVAVGIVSASHDLLPPADTANASFRTIAVSEISYEPAADPLYVRAVEVEVVGEPVSLELRVRAGGEWFACERRSSSWHCLARGLAFADVSAIEVRLSSVSS